MIIMKIRWIIILTGLAITGVLAGKIAAEKNRSQLTLPKATEASMPKAVKSNKISLPKTQFSNSMGGNIKLKQTTSVRIQESTKESVSKYAANPKWNVMEKVLHSNPHPDWMSQEKWNELVVHINADEEWILNNYYHDDSQKQCTFYMKGEKVLVSGLMSGALDKDGNEYFLPSDQHPDRPYHNHIGIFFVTHTKIDYWSNQWHCPMDYSVFYLNGNGQAMHAALPDRKKYLGSPDSHGCNRLHPVVASWIYSRADSTNKKILVVNVCLKA